MQIDRSCVNECSPNHFWHLTLSTFLIGMISSYTFGQRVVHLGSQSCKYVSHVAREKLSFNAEKRAKHRDEKQLALKGVKAFAGKDYWRPLVLAILFLGLTAIFGRSVSCAEGSCRTRCAESK